jgi:gluconokinase
MSEKASINLGDYQRPYVLAIDIGSSSARATLYDARATRIEGTEAQVSHGLHTDDVGAAVEQPEHLVENVESVIDEALRQAGDASEHIAAVAMDCMSSTMLGLDGEGRPVTPIYTYADTRPGDEVKELRRKLDLLEVYQRTGCPQHTSYLPSRFLWLRRNAPDLYEKVRLWVDAGTYLYTRWFGRMDVPMSDSMASWTGLLDRRRFQWDEELLRQTSVSVDSLPPLADYSTSQRGLCETFAKRWPALKDVQFFLGVGDGLSANVGSGCVSPDSPALTIGTSGAMRILLEDAPQEIPQGLWAYRLGRRTLLGGSFSDGGSVFAWAGDTLKLPEDNESIETALSSLPPDGHGLTVLPFLSGERSPGWSVDAAGVFYGVRMSTSSLEMLQAAMEGASYRFSTVWDLLAPYASTNAKIVASGGAITRSSYWLQLMADMLQRTVVTCIEGEATSRGTAILALHALGIWSKLDAMPAELGERYTPNPERMLVYQNARERQSCLYDLVIGQDF